MIGNIFKIFIHFILSIFLWGGVPAFAGDIAGDRNISTICKLDGKIGFLQYGVNSKGEISYIVVTVNKKESTSIFFSHKGDIEAVFDKNEKTKVIINNKFVFVDGANAKLNLMRAIKEKEFKEFIGDQKELAYKDVFEFIRHK